MILANSDSSTYTVNELPKAKQERQAPCLVNINEKQILFIGGHDSTETQIYGSTYQYNISKNITTRILLELNLPRFGSSGCYIDGHVFVIGGAKF